MNRGRFAYWGERRKKGLYELGKKNFGSYSKPRANFRGKFTNYKLPYDDEYQKVKMKSLMEAFGSGEKGETFEGHKINKWFHQTNLAMKLILHQKLMNQGQLAEYYTKNGEKMTRESISKRLSPVTVIL